jgi:beta-lactamase superfamily II metal-dependent hydrolase
MVQLYDIYSFLALSTIERATTATRDIDQWELERHEAIPPFNDDDNDDDNDDNDDIRVTLSCDQALILGDLNFHQESESVLIQAPFVDVWTSLNADKSAVDSYT